MYDEKGQAVWEARLDIYGKVHTFAGRSLSDSPFRYQGQYEDSETGLYYNRFRYYSPEEGVYLSQDPIGLAGNNPTLYDYVKDLNSWVDQFGLELTTANPNDINFSQRTVSEVRVFDANKYEPIRVMDVINKILSKKYNMNKYAKNIIQEYAYPIINSLAYSNGDMLIISGYKVNKNYILRILCKSSLDSYFHYNDESYVSHFSVPISEENSQYSVFAGEGSMGSDGIVFVMDKGKEEPLWFLFLDNSDPFEKIQFEASNIIVVQSSSGLKIRIPIDNPEKMKVI